MGGSEVQPVQDHLYSSWAWWHMPVIPSDCRRSSARQEAEGCSEAEIATALQLGDSETLKIRQK